MDLYEHQGKDVFRAHGIPTPRGIVAATPEQAADATGELGGRSVVKVQVQIGGRGKGGGVVLVDSPERAAEEAGRMLRDGFKDMVVNRVLVEELLPIAKEFYTSFVLDRSTGDYLAMMTAEGGVDIEELARTRPEAIRRVHVDPMLGLRMYHVRELTGTLPVEAREGAADILRKLYAILGEQDATLVEVNPLVLLEDGTVVALDAKVTIDDNALWRHPELDELKAAFPIDPVEARAKDAGLQYVKLDGEVGIIGNGAGLGDVDPRRGGAGGRQGRELPGHRRRRQRRHHVDVARGHPLGPGGEGRVDQHLRRHHALRPGGAGILEALVRIERAVPIVVRLDGTNARLGREILSGAAHPRIVSATTMLEAAQKAADLANAGEAA